VLCCALPLPTQKQHGERLRWFLGKKKKTVSRLLLLDSLSASSALLLLLSLLTLGFALLTF
jgi:hypothetical protein